MKRIMLLFMLATALALFPAEHARACSPIAWNFAKHLSVSRAILHGKVTAVSDGGAQATMQILNYTGPGSAPSIVTLPRTEMLRGGGNCPDLHLKFQVGAEYLVFLGDIPPALRLADPFRTALRVSADGHIRDMFGTQQTPVGLLQTFAAERGDSVRSPAPNGPRWGSAVSLSSPWRYLGLAIPLLLMAFIWWRRRGHSSSA